MLHLTSDIEYVLIASDGLYEEMTPDDVVAFVANQQKKNQNELLVTTKGRRSSKSDRPEKATVRDINQRKLDKLCERLVQEAMNLGSEDNISVIMVQLRGGWQAATSTLSVCDQESGVSKTPSGQLQEEIREDSYQDDGNNILCLLRTNNNFSQFYNHCKKHFCLEGLHFVLEVNNYRELPLLFRIELEKGMVERYIVDEAVESLNLPWDITDYVSLFCLYS